MFCPLLNLLNNLTTERDFSVNVKSLVKNHLKLLLISGLNQRLCSPNHILPRVLSFSVFPIKPQTTLIYLWQATSILCPFHLTAYCYLKPHVHVPPVTSNTCFGTKSVNFFNELVLFHKCAIFSFSVCFLFRIINSREKFV